MTNRTQQTQTNRGRLLSRTGLGALGLAAVIGAATVFTAPATRPAAAAAPEAVPAAPAAPRLPSAPAAPAAAAALAPLSPDAPGNLPNLPAGYDLGVTKASDQSEVAFPIPGVIREVKVKAGDQVKKGDVIVAQDDSEEIAAVNSAYQKVETEKLQVEAAQADLDKKKVDLKRIREVYQDYLAKDPNFTNTEIDEAIVNVKIGEVALKYRGASVEQAKYEWAMASTRLQHRKLLSPIDGVVAKVDLHSGEGTDIQRPSGILIVKNDPLWVEVDMPVARAAKLRKGQTLEVQYYGLGEEWMPAKVIYLADVADPRTGVRMVRLEMPNAAREDGTRRESGLQVVVRVPEGSNLAGGARTDASANSK